MKIKYDGVPPRKSPVRILDDWIEKHNCAIEKIAADPWMPWVRSYLTPAVDILSDVVDFFNGADPGALAQSGRADGR